MMKESTLYKRDWAVRDIPFPGLDKTSLKLNSVSHFFDYPQILAEQLGTGKDTIEWIDESKNPTEMFTSCHRGAKVGRLIEIIHEMEQPKVAKVLEDWVTEP